MCKYQNLFKSVNFTTHLTGYDNLTKRTNSQVIVLLLALQTHMLPKRVPKAMP